VRRTLTRDADGRDTGIALALPPGADSGGGSTPGSGARSENDIPLPPWAWMALALLMLATLHHHARTAPRPAASRPLAPRTLAALLIATLLAPLLPPPEALAFDTARRYDPAGNLLEAPVGAPPRALTAAGAQAEGLGSAALTVVHHYVYRGLIERLSCHLRLHKTPETRSMGGGAGGHEKAERTRCLREKRDLASARYRPARRHRAGERQQG
jgi:hypothetical protein